MIISKVFFCEHCIEASRFTSGRHNVQIFQNDADKSIFCSWSSKMWIETGECFLLFVDWRCLKTMGAWECLNSRQNKWQEVEEGCIMGSLMICTACQIWGWSVTDGKMCGEYGMYGREENLEEMLEWQSDGKRPFGLCECGGIILKGILNMWMEGVDSVSDWWEGRVLC